MDESGPESVLIALVAAALCGAIVVGIVWLISWLII